jgi:AAHS family 4-hydroxybenzoate transporter-like MFS transporter
VLGGALMHLQWSSASLFIAAAVPACVSMAGVPAIHLAMRGRASSDQAAGALQ